jgi:hypothetical protein
MTFEGKFKLGDVVREIFTGYTGVVVGVTFYLTGCTHYGIFNQELDKDGNMRDWVWLDGSKLELVKELTKTTINVTGNSGGPSQNAPEA